MRSVTRTAPNSVQSPMAGDARTEPGAARRANPSMRTVVLAIAGALLLIAVVSWVILHMDKAGAAPGDRPTVPASAGKP